MTKNLKYFLKLLVILNPISFQYAYAASQSWGNEQPSRIGLFTPDSAPQEYNPLIEDDLRDQALEAAERRIMMQILQEATIRAENEQIQRDIQDAIMDVTPEDMAAEDAEHAAWVCTVQEKQNRGDATQEEQENDIDQGTPKTRKPYTKEQIYLLKTMFRKHRYITKQQLQILSSQSQLTETQIKTWFINQRGRYK